MGLFGTYLISSINLRFITDVHFLQCLIILFGSVNVSVCLFEDQIGKFDWKQNYVGQIKYANFDTVSSTKKIILATEENVVAALNLKSGNLIWRQVLEKSQQGHIQHLSVDTEIVTVSGDNPWLIRGWNPSVGHILWEWSLALPYIGFHKVYWHVQDRKLINVVAIPSSHIEVTRYVLNTGHNNNTTVKITAPWMKDLSKCVMSEFVFSCLYMDGSFMKLIFINMVDEDYTVKTFSLQPYFQNENNLFISKIQGITPGIAVKGNNKVHVLIFEINEDAKVLDYDFPKNVYNLLTMEHNENKILLYMNYSLTMERIFAIGINNEDIPELSSNIPLIFDGVKLHSGICALKKDTGVACRYLISTSDGTISLIQNSGKILWSREESLSHITAVDLLDLPVSDLDASIEKEFDAKEGNFLSMLTRRVTSQINQLHILLLTIMSGRVPQSLNQQVGLVRDEFGLHKIILIATKKGKVFGLDNLTGKILWSKYLKGIAPFTANEKDFMILFVQRTTRHFPRPAQCTLIAKDIKSNESVLFIFNPINGEPVNETLFRTGYKMKQVMLLPKPNDEFLREILIIDENNYIHIYPKKSKRNLADLTKQAFIYTVEPTDGFLTGYTLAYGNSQNLILTPSWHVKLGSKDQHIKLVIGKNTIERVHSQGRVLVDRSVLYKYVNPNLVAVLTHGIDPIHKFVMNIYLVDVVSGAVIFSISHKRAKEAIHLVHSENWLLYSYFNDKWRRTEVGTLEFYEGKTQSNNTAFSSLAPPLLPLVERQSYILGSQIESMEVTLTEKGITSKHVLMALNNGGVIEMPWMFLDPRRPATITPEMREEGVVPYIPELPLPSEAYINYNQSLTRIRGIHTSPSGLESTCLVLVHGLDIFYTRVAPSKTFDLLKDDFDYSLIVIVLMALLFTSYVSKYFASRKALKLAWK